MPKLDRVLETALYVGRTDWPRGGRSVYFRDLDGYLLELATPGLWRIY
jgi:catechol 2,3-dioxygenase-like lactoylglutathione lyase family enzyme